jgi:S-adenosyl methyltransferase
MREADMPGLPPEIDTSRPHSARIYDYFLGGKNHFAADREVAEKSLASIPSGRTGAREQRAFLGRAVKFLAGEAGIRQFLDIGAGLPTANNVHEVAQAIVPSTRVVYVDNDRCKSGCSHVTTVVARLCAPNGGPAGGRARRHLSLLANRMEEVRAWLSADWRQRLAVPAPTPGCCCSGGRPSGR